MTMKQMMSLFAEQMALTRTMANSIASQTAAMISAIASQTAAIALSALSLGSVCPYLLFAQSVILPWHSTLCLYRFRFLLFLQHPADFLSLSPQCFGSRMAVCPSWQVSGLP